MVKKYIKMSRSKEGYDLVNAIITRMRIQHSEIHCKSGDTIVVCYCDDESADIIDYLGSCSAIHTLGATTAAQLFAEVTALSQYGVAGDYYDTAWIIQYESAPMGDIDERQEWFYYADRLSAYVIITQKESTRTMLVISQFNMNKFVKIVCDGAFRCDKYRYTYSPDRARGTRLCYDVRDGKGVFTVQDSHKGLSVEVSLEFMADLVYTAYRGTVPASELTYDDLANMVADNHRKQLHILAGKDYMRIMRLLPRDWRVLDDDGFLGAVYAALSDTAYTDNIAGNIHEGAWAFYTNNPMTGIDTKDWHELCDSNWRIARLNIGYIVAELDKQGVRQLLYVTAGLLEEFVTRRNEYKPNKVVPLSEWGDTLLSVKVEDDTVLFIVSDDSGRVVFEISDEILNAIGHYVEEITKPDERSPMSVLDTVVSIARSNITKC